MTTDKLCKHFNDEARQVMAHAVEEARLLRHTYVGTEHILLGLCHSAAGHTADVLMTIGVDLHPVRHEIEKVVCRGPEYVPPVELPMTPRAKQAIEFAQAEARNLNQSQVGPGHLLMGLLWEPDGVAGVVLRNLGVKLGAVGQSLFKIRLGQMKIVECAVRPVRAGITRKRKMREELLAHLTTI